MNHPDKVGFISVTKPLSVWLLDSKLHGHVRKILQSITGSEIEIPSQMIYDYLIVWNSVFHLYFILLHDTLHYLRCELVFGNKHFDHFNFYLVAPISRRVLFYYVFHILMSHMINLVTSLVSKIQAHYLHQNKSNECVFLERTMNCLVHWEPPKSSVQQKVGLFRFNSSIDQRS